MSRRRRSTGALQGQEPVALALQVLTGEKSRLAHGGPEWWKAHWTPPRVNLPLPVLRSEALQERNRHREPVPVGAFRRARVGPLRSPRVPHSLELEGPPRAGGQRRRARQHRIREPQPPTLTPPERYSFGVVRGPVGHRVPPRRGELPKRPAKSCRERARHPAVAPARPRHSHPGRR